MRRLSTILVKKKAQMMRVYLDDRKEESEAISMPKKGHKTSNPGKECSFVATTMDSVTSTELSLKAPTIPWPQPENEAGYNSRASNSLILETDLEI